MFGKDYRVIADITTKIHGAHHIWLAGSTIPYITLNFCELVFFSNQKKYQVLGHPSVKWREEDFLNVAETAHDLAAEILEQVAAYEREGKSILSAETWLAEVAAFESRKRERFQQLWKDDYEKLEIQIWADVLGTQENPIFNDLAVFLKCHLEEDRKPEDVPGKPHFRELLNSEIEEANALASFLTNHSNEILREGADWIPQWVEGH
jgi:hypothetical protein